ncbi:MAG: hypothetical protein H8E90_04150 [Anaerolineales bacterium]|nr:hypothetical protein [Anaerolineales bacterium]
MNHPRRDLSFTCSRRKFWPALLQEAFVLFGSVKGRQGCRLSELGSLPDDQLAQVKPIVNPNYEILLDQGYVWARYRSRPEEAPLRLFSTEQQEDLVVFNQFNGQHDLGQIGDRLSQEMGWDEAAAFAHARDLFLSLVRRLVCVPKDPLDLAG